ncbi:hypothetical protein KUV47_07665 [Vannielia litorea]|uniref:hypothetical protein n=1 Tax=Vannielia litorea TaxID=1217970 RepID=UPI001C98115D|nr:hypothetical protein [Vannielia litorea]MBY6153081.1 hypothetical protein [Vannielia litorea]
MGSLEAEDAAAQAALASLDSAAVPDVTDTSYQAQMAALGEYAQTAFNEVLAQYRFLGLLAGIKGPNDTDQDVENARDTVMEALADFLQAGPLGGQIQDGWDQILADRDALERDLFDDRTLSREDGYLARHVLGYAAPSTHPFDQSETTLEQMVQGATMYNNISADIERLPEPYRSRMQGLLDQYAQMAALEDVRRANRRAAVVAWFRRMWEGVRDYYNENMELIRNGQWLLATGRIAIDAAIFAAEEVVVAGIVTAIIGLTGGLAAGMALALRGAVRAMLSVVRQGSRVVRNVRATYVFRIEIRKIEPGVLYSNPMPINFNIGRRLDYDKSIDVEHDLTPDEARALGEGGQGSLEPDADAPEQGNSGGGDGPGDGTTGSQPGAGPLRSRDELLPEGRVPFDSNDASVFQNWWDDLSYDELEMLLGEGGSVRRQINSGVRNNGGMHEWLKVSQQLEHKRLGFSMREIHEWVTPTREAGGPLPQPTAAGDLTWRHSPPSGPGSGPGSVTMHRAMDALYGPPPARSREELLRRFGYFANSYLDGGIDGLPAGMRDAILQAGGG